LQACDVKWNMQMVIMQLLECSARHEGKFGTWWQHHVAAPPLLDYLAIVGSLKIETNTNKI